MYVSILHGTHAMSLAWPVLPENRWSHFLADVTLSKIEVRRQRAIGRCDHHWIFVPVVSHASMENQFRTRQWLSSSSLDEREGDGEKNQGTEFDVSIRCQRWNHVWKHSSNQQSIFDLIVSASIDNNDVEVNSNTVGVSRYGRRQRHCQASPVLNEKNEILECRPFWLILTLIFKSRTAAKQKEREREKRFLSTWKLQTRRVPMTIFKSIIIVSRSDRTATSRVPCTFFRRQVRMLATHTGWLTATFIHLTVSIVGIHHR